MYPTFFMGLTASVSSDEMFRTSGFFRENTLLSTNRLTRSASAWANIKLAPPDKILGLNEAFKNDPAKIKVNLGVGAYRDDNGLPMVLKSVREAENRLVAKQLDHE